MPGLRYFVQAAGGLVADVGVATGVVDQHVHLWGQDVECFFDLPGIARVESDGTHVRAQVRGGRLQHVAAPPGDHYLVP